MPKQPATLGQFACLQCNKRFTRNSDVERHINNSHLGLKPFMCGYCDKAFSQKANLTRHFTSCSAVRAVRAASAEASAEAASALDPTPSSSGTWPLPSPIIVDDSMPLFPLEASLFPALVPPAAETATPPAAPELALQSVALNDAAAAPSAPAVRKGPPRIRARRPAPYYKTQRPGYQPPQEQEPGHTQPASTQDFALLASLMSTPTAFDNALSAPKLDAPAPQLPWVDFATGNLPIPMQEPMFPIGPPPSQTQDLSFLAPQSGSSALPGSVVWDPATHTIDDLLLRAWNPTTQSIDLWDGTSF